MIRPLRVRPALLLCLVAILHSASLDSVMAAPRARSISRLAQDFRLREPGGSRDHYGRALVKGGSDGRAGDIASATLTADLSHEGSIDGPTKVCPGSTDVHCGPGGMVSYVWSVSGGGSIVGAIDGQCVQVLAGTSCGERYVLSLSFGCGTDCGGTAEKAVSVEDTTAPQIICPADARFECDEMPDFGLPTSEDDCDTSPEITWSDQFVPGPRPNDYQVVRTWTATDDCGNKASCQQVVQVMDTTPPVINCPSDRTFECSQFVNFGEAAAGDNCDATPEIAWSDETVPGSNPANYQILRTWVASDDCGNMASCLQVVTVADVTPPEMPPVSIFRIPCKADTAYLDINIVVIDNCGNVLEAQLVEVVDIEHEIHRRYTAADPAGNVGSCSVIIQVLDDAGPVLVGAPDDTLACGQPVAFTDPTAADNCDSAPVVVQVSDTVRDGPGECEVSYVRCWEAHDNVDNVSGQVCQTLVRYEDIEAPTVTCAANKVIESGDFVIFDKPAVTDNCPMGGSGLPGITFTESTDVLEGETTYTRCWVARDSCGNESEECCQSVTVHEAAVPSQFSMTVGPNPLHESVTISLALPADGDVSLDIYDVEGRVVMTLMRGHQFAGYYRVTWYGADRFGSRVKSGIYFCRLQINGRLAAMEKLMKL